MRCIMFFTFYMISEKKLIKLVETLASIKLLDISCSLHSFMYIKAQAYKIHITTTIENRERTIISGDHFRLHSSVTRMPRGSNHFFSGIDVVGRTYIMKLAGRATMLGRDIPLICRTKAKGRDKGYSEITRRMRVKSVSLKRRTG